ncbi:MAG: hypothetical protein REJ23_04825 [Brevundimonas sp.]|nr:hypothetical protein [Brevundimonas sp.]
MTMVSVELDDRMEAFVDEKVRSGAFRDRAAVLARALGDMERRDRLAQPFEDALQEGLDDVTAGRVMEIDDIPAWIDGLGRD